MTDQELIMMHTTGATQTKLAESAGMSVSGLRKRMRRLGLHGHSAGSRDYQINDTVFDIIDTEHKAYWLGFILADGCIAKSAGTRRAFRLSLQKRDEPHIHKITEFLNYKGRLYPDNRNNHPRMCLVFNSVRLCSKLCEHGWLEFKNSGNYKIIEQVPDHLFNHFVRGYFDGDGSITRSKKKLDWYAAIVGPHEKTLEYISKRVADAICVERNVRPHRTIFKIVWNGKHQLTKFLEWLYNDSTVHLERKMTKVIERSDSAVYAFKSIHNFRFSNDSNYIIGRNDCNDIVDRFTNDILSSDWVPPEYDIDIIYDKLKNYEYDKIIKDGIATPSANTGWQLISHFQPLIWHISQGKKPAISYYHNHQAIVKRSIKAFLLSPGKKLYPQRLLREMLFAGFTKASLLSVPLIMAAIKHFGLSGTWFDPCAGWGNRLLAANLLGIKYCGTDPGHSFNGLLELKKWLKSDAIVANDKWQDADWPQCDFILTSPPFHNKEDYLDGVVYGTFADWYCTFLRPLADKCCTISDSTVFHVDAAMKNALSNDFDIDELPISSGSRHKAPKEWFIKLSKKE